MREANVYAYGTHLPLLTQAMLHTTGPVLECGGGLCSTPVMHALCVRTEPQRCMVTAEEKESWFVGLQRQYACPWHSVMHVRSWEQFFERMGRQWSVALVDNDDSRESGEKVCYENRLTVLKLLSPETVTIVHDTQHPYIAEDAWWKERVASSPFVWTHEACGIQTTLLAARELPEIGERVCHRQ